MHASGWHRSRSQGSDQPSCHFLIDAIGGVWSTASQAERLIGVGVNDHDVRRLEFVNCARYQPGDLRDLCPREFPFRRNVTEAFAPRSRSMKTSPSPLPGGRERS